MATIHADPQTFTNTCTFTGAVSLAGGVTFDDPSSFTVGDGSASPTLTLDKGETGTADILLQKGAVTRSRIRLDASEDLVIGRLNSSGVLQDSITYANSSGLVTLPAALTVTGATTAAAITASGTVTCNGTLDANGAITLDGASSITYPPNYPGVRRYVSQAITEADFSAGATDEVALTGFPTACQPIACYVVTSGGPVVSGDGATTGLTASVGLTGGGNGELYLGAASVFGAAGRKEGSTGGSLLGKYRAADAPIVVFTAVGGGSEDVTDITGLSLRVVVHYIPVAAEV